MVDVKCLVCGKSLKIPPDIDLNNYDGQLFCRACQLLWDIKLVASKVRKYKLAQKQPEPIPSKLTVKMNIPDRDYSKEAQGDIKEN